MAVRLIVALGALAAIAVTVALLIAGADDPKRDAGAVFFGSPASDTKALDGRIETASARTHRRPRQPGGWADLARLWFQRAGVAGLSADRSAYTDEGKADLRSAARAWERHLALGPDPPDAGVARLIVQAYGADGLDQPIKAVRAMEILTAARNPPSWNLYASLAAMAYSAAEQRTGDNAADRAVELAPDAKKRLVRTTLERLRTEAKPRRATPRG